MAMDAMIGKGKVAEGYLRRGDSRVAEEAIEFGKALALGTDRAKQVRKFVTQLIASLTTELAGDNNDLTYTAGDNYAGAAGNYIQIEYVDSGVDGQALTVSVSGSGTAADPYKITVILGRSSATAASLTTELTGDNNDLVFTAQDAYKGAVGNNIQVAYIDPGAADAALSVDVDGLGTADNPFVINVSLATDGTGTITSTAAQVQAAIEAHADASVLVSVANAAGNDGSGVVTAMAATALAGGTDSAVNSTAADIITAIQAHAAGAGEPANAGDLVSVANADGNDGSGVVTTLNATSLSGGRDGVPAAQAVFQGIAVPNTSADLENERFRQYDPVTVGRQGVFWVETVEDVEAGDGAAIDNATGDFRPADTAETDVTSIAGVFKSATDSNGYAKLEINLP